jgi:hypothetical protein
MTLRHRQIFLDPDDYAAAFGAAAVSLTIVGPGEFTAYINRLQLQHLDLYLCTERLSRIAFISLPSDRIFVTFPYGESSIVINGHELSVREMFLQCRGSLSAVKRTSAFSIVVAGTRKTWRLSLRSKAYRCPSLGATIISCLPPIDRIRMGGFDTSQSCQSPGTSCQ